MAPGYENNSPVPVHVRRLLPFGLLVSLEDGRTGVIRERELAWERDARHRWREHFKPGDKLRAVIIGERHDKHLELSLRLVHHNPWQDLTERYQPGELVDGIVTGVQPYGVFVQIDPGVTGLVHRTRLPTWAREDLVDSFWPGDYVRVAIEAIDTAHRRLSLNLSKAWAHRWAAGDGQQTKQPSFEAVSREQRAPASDKPARLPLELFLEQRKSWSILVVEDDKVQCRAIADWLRKAGQYVVAATSAEDALTFLQNEQPDLVLMDVGLPGMDGIQAIRQVRARQPKVRSVVMTDWARADEHLDELEALRAEGVSLLIKPLLPEDLLGVLSGTVEDETVERDADSPTEGLTIASNAPQTMSVSRESLNDTLTRLRRLTSATKVVLFALDPAQRKVNVVAESGHGMLRENALVHLIHSPVRDVAEDHSIVQVEDVQFVAARVRYLRPLLPFTSCLGVPVPGDLPERHALFLFHSRPGAFSETHEEHARAGALALGALLERQQFELRAMEMQRLALLGQLTRALVHEINHQLSPVGFALEGLEEQCARIERLASKSPNVVEGEVRLAREMLRDLTQGVRNLIETARLFGRVTIQGREQILRLDTMVEEVVDLVRDMADRAHVTIEVNPAPRLLFTRTQATQVQQVLLNIMLNAIQQIALTRPREGGRVQIRLGGKRRGKNVVLQVSVEDDGPGVHRRLWERIFELGFTTRREEGSGLGLYITRSLVEALEGRVYVAESYTMWGTTFVVELPLKT